MLNKPLIVLMILISSGLATIKRPDSLLSPVDEYIKYIKSEKYTKMINKTNPLYESRMDMINEALTEIGKLVEPNDYEDRKCVDQCSVDEFLRGYSKPIVNDSNASLVLIEYSLKWPAELLQCHPYPGSKLVCAATLNWSNVREKDTECVKDFVCTFLFHGVTIPSAL